MCNTIPEALHKAPNLYINFSSLLFSFPFYSLFFPSLCTLINAHKQSPIVQYGSLMRKNKTIYREWKLYVFYVEVYRLLLLIEIWSPPWQWRWSREITRWALSDITDSSGEADFGNANTHLSEAKESPPLSSEAKTEWSLMSIKRPSMVGKDLQLLGIF